MIGNVVFVLFTRFIYSPSLISTYYYGFFSYLTNQYIAYKLSYVVFAADNLKDKWEIAAVLYT